MRRTLLSFFTWIALASLVLTSACSGQGTAKEQPTPTPLPTPAAASKPTYKVTRGDVTAQVQFSARIIPAIQEELFFRTDGRVRKVYVRTGDPVKKGQVLADLISLDQMELQSQQQKFDQRKAEINLEMAWLRQQLAATQDSTWNAGYEIRQKMNQFDVELAQIALDESKLQTKNLDTNISDSQITATLDGKVLSIDVLEGSEIRAFNALITVGDDSQLEVGATLTSTQMQELSEGMVAAVELPNRPGDKLAGKLRALPYPYGTGGGTQTSKSTTTGGAGADNTTRIALDNADSIKGFRLGDLVQVTVIKESKTNVLWLPPQGIRTFEGRNFVVIKTDGLPKRVDVRLGIKNEEQVEITDGVEEGQIVIAP
jgi:membrane fusion protein, macrolide-specific efflux system